jgi:superoxide oxidase
MARRTLVKWLHWLSFGLILYFFVVEPDDVPSDPAAGLSLHAGMGLLLAAVALVWISLYLAKGLSGRPGPKLPGWAKTFHPVGHKTLQIGVPVIVASGALAGLAAPFVIRAFESLPINPGFGSKGIHEFVQEVHELLFDGLILLIAVHIAFHLWRHFWLKDNALRIMIPRILHKYL